MKIALLLLNLIPLISQLIAAAESIFPQANQGQLKKTSVTASIRQFLDVLVSSGSIKNSDLPQLLKAISTIIDAAVTTANAFKSNQVSPIPSEK